MRKAINQWTFPDTMDLDACLALASRAGFEGIELVLTEPVEGGTTAGGGGAEHIALPMTYLGFHPYESSLTTASTTDDVRAIRAKVDDAGLVVPSIASVLPFIHPLSGPDEETRARGVAIVSQALEFGAILGCESVLVIPGLVGPNTPYDVAMRNLEKSVRELAPVAERHGVTLALENVWNQFLLSPLEFRDLLDRIGHPRVKAYFDVGNIVKTGFGEQWIDILGDRIDKVHFCNFRAEVGNITGFTRHLLDGDVNWPAIMSSLADVGYDGWVTVEITPPAAHYPEKVILDLSTTMDWILAAGDPAAKGGER